MKTRSFIPLSIAVLTLILVSCGAATTPNPVQTPVPPLLAATNTPAPGGTGTVDVTIKNFAFDPPTITVKVGTTVVWTNQDSANHSITSDTGIWDSGGIAQGGTYTRVFDTLGTFTYKCGIHPTMKGTIIVTS
jgi:plastocyanin